MIAQTEPQNVSQQPDCLDFRPYTVVVDIGKPFEEKAEDLDKVEEVLKNVHQRFIVEEECPHVDVKVYDGIDRDVTESQAIQEIVADILEEKWCSNCQGSGENQPFDEACPVCNGSGLVE